MVVHYYSPVSIPTPFRIQINKFPPNASMFSFCTSLSTWRDPHKKLSQSIFISLFINSLLILERAQFFKWVFSLSGIADPHISAEKSKFSVVFCDKKVYMKKKDLLCRKIDTGRTKSSGTVNFFECYTIYQITKNMCSK